MRAAVLILLLFAAHAAPAQVYPDKIRGYKVHREKVAVRSASEPANGQGITVSIGKLEIERVGVDGVKVLLVPAADGIERSGTVEMITVKDLAVNGIAASVDEFSTPFVLVPGRSVRLPGPMRLTVSLPDAARAAYREITDPQKKWRVTGTAFVFGRFRKFGFAFKRVVPVPFDLIIDNPLER